MDGEDGEDEGLRNHLEQLAYPRFSGISPQIHRAARCCCIKEHLRRDITGDAAEAGGNPAATLHE